MFAVATVGTHVTWPSAPETLYFPLRGAIANLVASPLAVCAENVP
jgi:hypothetical protein